MGGVFYYNSPELLKSVHESAVCLHGFVALRFGAKAVMSQTFSPRHTLKAIHPFALSPHSLWGQLDHKKYIFKRSKNANMQEKNL